MSRPKPDLDVLTINFTEALGIYLYAHGRLDHPRDVAQASVERFHGVTDEQGYAMTPSAFLVYRGRGAHARRLDIPASPDAFAFELQQTLARYAAGLVDAEIHGVDYDDR